MKTSEAVDALLEEPLSKDERMIGTPKAGYSTAGPFRCSNCRHAYAAGGGRRCKHPEMIKDPETEKDRAGRPIIEPSACCNYFAP